jgi:hypothetical protein
MVTETKTPANDDAGTSDTSNARKSVLRAVMGRIAWLLASPRAKSTCELGVTGQNNRHDRMNAMPGIMLLASHRKVTWGSPTVLRLSTMCVGGYPTFAARGAKRG